MLNRFIIPMQNIYIALLYGSKSVSIKKMLVNFENFGHLNVGVKSTPIFLAALSFIGVKDSKTLSDMENSTIDLLKKADQLFDRDRYEEALDLLNSIQDQSKSDVKWRQGRVLFKIYECDKKHRQELVLQALELVNEALKLNNRDSGALEWMYKYFPNNKFMAVLIDAKGEVEGDYQRIKNLPKVKEYMLSAVKINPKDAFGWYLLGSYSYALANLKWHQRKILQFIHPSINETNENALKNFLRAEEESPKSYSLNILYIGKCYDAMGDYEKAKYYLNLASNVKVLNKDDRRCKETALSLLKKYAEK